MTVTVEIPDILFQNRHLTQEEVSGQILEKFALDAYCAGNISRGKVGELLGLNFWQTEEFLKKHKASQDLSFEEIIASVESMRKRDQAGK